MKNSRKTINTLTTLIIISGIIFSYPKIQNKIETILIENENNRTIEAIELAQTLTTDIDTNTQSKLLDVQFICQAPLQTTQNWELHEESCEEAALLQAYVYETNQEITKEEADQIILDMIDWQNEHFGGHHDLYADQMKQFIIEYYNLQPHEVEVKKNASISDIKKYVIQNHPVIVPITGKILKNPYYPYPGYHMLTVTGFTEDKIVTNDNGTRHGEKFSYDISVFEEAFKDAGNEIIVLKLDKKN